MSFNRQLKKLQKEKDALDKHYGELYRKAKRENKPYEEIDSIRTEATMETQFVELEIDSIVTHELTKKAEKLFLPIPQRDNDEFWKDSILTENIRHLTPAGITKLRREILEDTKRRRESKLATIEVVAKIVAMLTGLVGATIGLVTILSK